MALRNVEPALTALIRAGAGPEYVPVQLDMIRLGLFTKKNYNVSTAKHAQIVLDEKYVGKYKKHNYQGATIVLPDGRALWYIRYRRPRCPLGA